MLTKKEKEKIRKQMHTSGDRGLTWIGYRPAVMQDRKHDVKSSRRDAKKLCKSYLP